MNKELFDLYIRYSCFSCKHYATHQCLECGYKLLADILNDAYTYKKDLT